MLCWELPGMLDGMEVEGFRWTNGMEGPYLLKESQLENIFHLAEMKSVEILQNSNTEHLAIWPFVILSDSVIYSIQYTSCYDSLIRNIRQVTGDINEADAGVLPTGLAKFAIQALSLLPSQSVELHLIHADSRMQCSSRQLLTKS